MNPSQEPAQPQRSEQSFADPTAEPAVNGEASVWSGPGGVGQQGNGTGSAGAAGERENGAGGAGERENSAGAAGEWENGAGGAGRPGDGAGGGGWPGDGGYGVGPAGAAEGGYGLAHPSGPEEGYPDLAAGYAEGWGDLRSPRRPWRRTAWVAVLTGVGILVLGGPLGLLWAWLAPSVPVLDAGQTGIVVNDPSPEEYIAADGWYTLLGLGFGLVVAVVAWLVLRKDRGPFLLLGVVLGTLGAGYLIGPWIGGMIGRSGYRHWQDTAVQGATYLAPPQVHSVGPKLVAAFAAAIVLTLLAGWSNDPDLDEPGAKPGYGPNAGPGGDAGELVPAAELHQSETGA